MFDISAILHCLSVHLDKKNLRQLGLIVSAMLAMTGRMTMLGISRWTERGGSYRTIQRFFNSNSCGASCTGTCCVAIWFWMTRFTSWLGMRWWLPKPVSRALA